MWCIAAVSDGNGDQQGSRLLVSLTAAFLITTSVLICGRMDVGEQFVVEAVLQFVVAAVLQFVVYPAMILGMIAAI
jgi:hypothetical protein